VFPGTLVIREGPLFLWARLVLQVHHLLSLREVRLAPLVLGTLVHLAGPSVLEALCHPFLLLRHCSHTWIQCTHGRPLNPNPQSVSRL